MFPDATEAEEFGTTASAAERMGGAVVAAGSSALPGLPTGGVDVGLDLSGLEPLTRGGGGHSLASDPTAPYAGLEGMSLGYEAKVTCASCGQAQKVAKSVGGDQPKCSKCGATLEPDESAFVGNQFSQPAPGPEFALHLSDDKEVTCPRCKTKNAADAKTCTNCKMDLSSLDADQGDPAAEGMILHLSAEALTSLDLAPNAKQRQDWAKEGKAKSDGSWPIPNAAYLKKACEAFPGRAQGSEGAVKTWIMKRAKELGSEDIPELAHVKEYGGGKESSTNASAHPEHGVSIFQLQLDHTTGDQGLIWKVLCKTGTLALSPGPGQTDVERPLNLTPDLFLAVKQAYDDRAFEHVTIPETHANGVLENTGTVDSLEVLSHADAMKDARLSQVVKDTIKPDSADTLYMLGGLNFTDPKVKEKAANGSILNCSVGFKFNYRRKRDGKLYPAAMEHLALTNQPWVDGLGAFGGVNASEPFDQDELPVWDGVFMAAQAPKVEPAKETPSDKEGGGSSSATLSASAEPGTLPLAMKPDDNTDVTLEQVLAHQTAELEALQTRNAQLEQRLGLSQTQLDEQGLVLHRTKVRERIKTLQGHGVPASLLVRAENVMLGDYGQDVPTLNLSIQGTDGPVEATMRPSDIVEYMLAGTPVASADPAKASLYDITTTIGADAMVLSQTVSNEDTRSPADKADEIERGLHPERFGSDGKRLSLSQRTGAAA